MTAIDVKLKHKDFAPNGTWFWVAHENDRHYVDDEMIYHYVHNNIKFEDWKVGDKIELDDWFEIMEIGQIVRVNKGNDWRLKR